MNIESKDGHLIVHCEHTLNVTTVAAQHKILLESLNSNLPIHLDASIIYKLDTAGIQLLLYFCRQADKKKISWQWEKASSTLINIATLLGAEDLLRLPCEKPSDISSHNSTKGTA